MKLSIAIITILLAIGCKGQSYEIDTLDFQPNDSIFQASEIIDKKTFSLEFRIRVLPDNFWFLKLNKNSTYEYFYLSGFGGPKETILEEGRYEITENLIRLHPNDKESDLNDRELHIYTSNSTKPGDNVFIDCVKKKSKYYCLYQKFKKLNNR